MVCAVKGDLLTSLAVLLCLSVANERTTIIGVHTSVAFSATVADATGATGTGETAFFPRSLSPTVAWCENDVDTETLRKAL